MTSNRAPGIVGWREWVELPGLSARAFRAKLDTGARTSALHVEDMAIEMVDGRPFVRFTLDRAQQGAAPPHCLPVIDRRLVTPSSDEGEHRYVVEATLKIDGLTWPIEVTLTDRTDMQYPMLIGRAALAGRLIVDPAQSYVAGRPVRRRKRPRAQAPEPAAAGHRGKT